MTLPLQGVPEFNQLQIVKTGTISVNVDSAPLDTGELISHNLGYKPLVIAQVSTPNAPNIYWLVQYNLFDGSGGVFSDAKVFVDEDTIQFRVYVASGTLYLGNWNFRYYLLRSREQ